MQPTTRYLEPERLPRAQRLLELWFAPKSFESTELYERLGVMLVKRYAPTGGDFFVQKYGIRIVDIQDNLESLIHFEQLTRIQEAIHVFAFLGFVAWSVRRLVRRETGLLDFLFAVVVYTALILSPAALQRYNRIRVYRVIRRLALRQGRR